MANPAATLKAEPIEKSLNMVGVLSDCFISVFVNAKIRRG
jgi:hypothetical protein